MLVLALACHDPEPPPPPPRAAPPELVGALEVVPADEPTVRLVHRLRVTTDRPTQLTVVLADGERTRAIGFPEVAEAHDVPLLGLLAETEYAVGAILTDEDGQTTQADASFTTGAAHEGLPDLEVLVADEARMEPGYTVFPAEIDGPAVIVAVDAAGRPVWSCSRGTVLSRALGFADGVFSALTGPEVVRFDATGAVVARWIEDGATAAGAVTLPDDLHHEVTFEADGSFWSFRKDAVEVPDYPASYDDPSVTAAAVLAADTVVHYAPDGTVLHELDLASRLDPRRIGYDSLEPAANGDLDWSHGNSILPLGDAVIVSLRHQDALVKLRLPEGDVEWILANPDGWSPHLDALRLQPVGDDFSWPYHQHAPMFDADGRLWIFDNGNEARTTPYAQDPDPLGSWSRLAAYVVDEEARTVRLDLASLAADAPLYSEALGNADVLPLTGNVLATFGWLEGEEDGPNVAAGRGAQSVRVAEVDPGTDEVVFALRVSTPFRAQPDGVLTDRAIRVPSLYGAGVTERWLDGSAMIGTSEGR